MQEFTIHQYKPEFKEQWDAFVATAKNATFLFYRDFMEYHADRFMDASLLIYKGKKLFALLPANQVKSAVISHQGLSYGGLILQKNAKLDEVILAFAKIKQHLRDQGFRELYLKILPDFYATHPSGELEYIMFLLDAKLIKVEPTSLIDLTQKVNIHRSRKDGIRKAKNLDLKIEESKDFASFWNKILIPNLALRHEVAPVHNLHEIEKLASHFPENIRQFNVYNKDEIVAGTTIFETKTTAHVQYISANVDRQKHGALDLLFATLITDTFSRKRYFDFGISTIDGGKKLNLGLNNWKSGFGASPFTQKTYLVDLLQTSNLKQVIQ